MDPRRTETSLTCWPNAITWRGLPPLKLPPSTPRASTSGRAGTWRGSASDPRADVSGSPLFDCAHPHPRRSPDPGAVTSVVDRDFSARSPTTACQVPPLTLSGCRRLRHGEEPSFSRAQSADSAVISRGYESPPDATRMIALDRRRGRVVAAAAAAVFHEARIRSSRALAAGRIGSAWPSSPNCADAPQPSRRQVLKSGCSVIHRLIELRESSVSTRWPIPSSSRITAVCRQWNDEAHRDGALRALDRDPGLNGRTHHHTARSPSTTVTSLLEAVRGAASDSGTLRSGRAGITRATKRAAASTQPRHPALPRNLQTGPRRHHMDIISTLNAGYQRPGASIF